MDDAIFEEESATYEREKKHRLSEAEGLYVLIKGSSVVAFHCDEMDAATDGIRRFGNVPTCVKKIAQPDEPLYLYAVLPCLDTACLPARAIACKPI